MHANIPLLEKKAIKLALKEEWEDSIQLNKEIIEADPDNIKAKIRLGHAYLQKKDFSKAEKLFKEVLDEDPINSVAKKNYELAKCKKTNKVASKSTNGKSLVKEPGTTVEVGLTITAKGFTANKLSYGEELGVDVLTKQANIVYKKTTLGTIKDPTIFGRLKIAKNNKSEITALFIKGEKKDIRILLECSSPVFKGDKQDIKPYMKKGTLDEPEIEIESYDDSE